MEIFTNKDLYPILIYSSPVSLCLGGLHVLEETGQAGAREPLAHGGGHDAAILGSGVRMPGF